MGACRAGITPSVPSGRRGPWPGAITSTRPPTLVSAGSQSHRAEPHQKRRAGGSLDASNSHIRRGDRFGRHALGSRADVTGTGLSWSGCRTRWRHEGSGARRHDGNGHDGGRPGRPAHGPARPIGPEGAEAQGGTEGQDLRLYPEGEPEEPRPDADQDVRRQREPAGDDGGREAVPARDRRGDRPDPRRPNRRNGSTRSSSRTKGRWPSPAPRSPPSSGSTRARKSTSRGS